jgi:hypothetical protein
MTREQTGVARAIKAALTSPNVRDSNGEVANVVDAMDDLARGVWAVARAIGRVADALAVGRYVEAGRREANRP